MSSSCCKATPCSESTQHQARLFTFEAKTPTAKVISRLACQTSPTSPFTASRTTSDWQRVPESRRCQATGSTATIVHCEHRRNRRHLLSVPEPAPAKLTCPAATDYDVPYVPPSRVIPPSSQSPPEQSPVNTQAGPSGPPENLQRSPVKTPTKPSESEGYGSSSERSILIWLSI